jgi:hypothetical protein
MQKRFVGLHLPVQPKSDRLALAIQSKSQYWIPAELSGFELGLHLPACLG